MKSLLFCFAGILLYYAAGAQQCPAPVITASGPATICPGGSVTLSVPSPDKVWTKKADLAGTARMGAVGFSIGNKGYIGTGAASLTDAGSVKKDLWEWDPATNAWTQKADFGGPARSYATAFSINGKGYVGTGSSGSTVMRDFWEYDPATNTWIQKATFGGQSRNNATGFSIGAKGYIGTGFSGGGPLKDFWEYNPATDVWTRKTDFGGTARYGATAFSVNGKGYIGTGYEGGTSYKKDFWAYDPATDSWAQKADFGGVARAFAAGFGIDSMGYIGTGSYTSSSRGGVITYEAVSDFWEYNTTINVWTQKANYGGGGPERTISFTLNNRGYVGTGRAAVDPYTGVALKDFLEYGPAYTYVWSPGGQTSPSITVTAPGNYTVTATNTQGCSATSAITISGDQTPPVITPKNITVYLNASGRATIQPFGVVQSVTDNCSLDSASVRVSQSTFACTDLAASDSIAKHQAYVTGTSTGVQAWRGELGMEFTVNKRIIVSRLGAFDHQGNGITGTQSGGIRVAVFNKATQAIVPGLDVIISAQGDAFVFNHRFKNVAPVTLQPGNYVIVTKGYNSAELNGNVALGTPATTGDDAGGAIAYTGTSRYGFDTDNGFGYPQYADAGPANRYLAGTFTYSIDTDKHQAYTAGTSTGNQAWRGELGMEFTVNRRILISQLGAFDHQGNGITGTQSGGIRVAVFNKATQTIVPGLDAIVRGQGDAYSANHRLVNITPVALLPGNYVVVTKGYNSAELNGNTALGTPVTTGDDAGGAIAYTGTSRYGFDTDNGFGYPQYADAGPANRYLAGTIIYQVSEREGSKLVTITAGDTRGNTATASALVTIKDSLGACSNSSAAPATMPQVQLTSASDESASGIRLYPNPVRDRFSVQLSGMRGTKGTIELLDVNGRVLEQRAVGFGGKASVQTQAFSLSAQPSGVYFVRVKSEEGVKTLKVIVVR